MKSLCQPILLLLAFCSLAYAQEKIGPAYFINAGLAIPSSPSTFTDYWNSGPNIGGGIGIPISSNVMFVGNLIYSSFGFDDDKFLTDYGYGGYGFQISGGTASITYISADFKAALTSSPSNTIPFLVGGAGLFRVSFSEATISYQGESATVAGDSETKLGIDIGAGLDITLSPRTKLQLGVKYIVGFTESESTQYFPIQVGLSFR